jgi:hypothetical protein
VAFTNFQGFFPGQLLDPATVPMDGDLARLWRMHQRKPDMALVLSFDVPRLLYVFVHALI